MVRLYRLSLVILLAGGVACPGARASADELPAEFQPMFEKCDRGTAADGYMCLVEVLADLDRMLAQSLDRASARVDSMWGEEANAEIRAQLTASQVSWRAYRQEHCHAALGYSTRADVHPPSQSQGILNCMARRTVERILEVRRDYLASP